MFGLALYVLLVLCICLPLFWLAGAYARARPWVFFAGGVSATVLGYVVEREGLFLAASLQSIGVAIDGFDHAARLIGVLCVALAGAFLSSAVDSRARVLHEKESEVLLRRISESEALLERLFQRLEETRAFSSHDPGDVALHRNKESGLVESSLHTMEALDELRSSLRRISPS